MKFEHDWKRLLVAFAFTWIIVIGFMLLVFTLALMINAFGPASFSFFIIFGLIWWLAYQMIGDRI